MKKRMNRFGLKITSLLLTLALAVSLCACGSKKTDAGNAGSGQTPTAAAETGTPTPAEDEQAAENPLTVNFTMDNFVDMEVADDGTVSSVTYRAGNVDVKFLTLGVSINDDGTLRLSSYAEMVTESGIENPTAVSLVSSAGLDDPINANGLYKLETPVDFCIYGICSSNTQYSMDEAGNTFVSFGQAVERVSLQYVSYDESGFCTLSAISFTLGTGADAVPDDLEPCYVSLLNSVNNTEEYGSRYSLTWDFADPGCIVEKTEENGYLTSLSLYNSATGETETFACDKCRLENGALTIEDGGSMVLLSEMGGIGYMAVNLNGTYDNSGFVFFGYDVYDAKLAASPDELIWACGNYLENNGIGCISNTVNNMPNFFEFYPLEGYSLSISSLEITYDDTPTGLLSARLNTDFYGYYLEGGYYDASKENFSEKDGIYDFYLCVTPDSAEAAASAYSEPVQVYGVDSGLYTIGNIKSADGTVKSKTDKLAVGDTLEVQIGSYTFDVELPVCRAFAASSLKELMPADFVTSTGTVNVLVVPMYFEDQQVDTESLSDSLYSWLGRILKEDGTVTDMADGSADFSFSEYFDRASYGNLQINSFVTEWYKLPGSVEANCQSPISDDLVTLAELQTWLNDRYSDMLPYLDADSDGLYDAVVFLTAPIDISEGYATVSYEGAYNSSLEYTFSRAITDGSGAGINHFSNVNMSFFMTNGQISTGTLCHEFSHQLGLIDYYDVTNSGVSALGGYDMQDNNEGDWNVYSKYVAGWINPTVVTQSDIDAGITLTINAFETDGSAIVIPTADTEINEDGSISPFSEYLILDLFTPEGLYTGTCEKYGLTEAGVRIYHADARKLTINAEDSEGTPYTVGTEVYTNAYNATGRYELELIGAGGINTFTDLEGGNCGSMVSDADLFKAGDTFTAADYSTFFYNGLMDDGSTIDFTITIVDISNGTATVKICR